MPFKKSSTRRTYVAYVHISMTAGYEMGAVRRESEII